MKTILSIVSSFLFAIGSLQASETSLSPETNAILLRIDWEFCQPAANQFDWQFIDAQIESARKQGKKIDLLIDASAALPEWMQQANAAASNALPLSITQMDQLSYWTRFITKMGERYQAETTLNKIYISQLPTLHPQNNESNLKDVLESWMKVVDAFDAAFPKQTIVSSGLAKQNETVQKLIEAYASQKMGSRFIPIVPTKSSYAPLLNRQVPVHLSPCLGKPVELKQDAIAATSNHTHRKHASIAQDTEEVAADHVIEKLISNLIVLGKPAITTILQ
ncbi:MAG: hypothetical protein FGM61_03180 [Sediminibacterium sp.]|nr:hypothetical protein [Sediminibacterium sp.]